MCVKPPLIWRTSASSILKKRKHPTLLFSLDVDWFSFELREINRTPPIQKFVFDKGILDDVLQAVQTGGRVKVTGRNFPVKNLAF